MERDRQRKVAVLGFAALAIVIIIVIVLYVYKKKTSVSSKVEVSIDHRLIGRWSGEETPWPQHYRSFLIVEFKPSGTIVAQLVSKMTEDQLNGDPFPLIVPWERAPLYEYNYYNVNDHELIVSMLSRMVDDGYGDVMDTIVPELEGDREWFYSFDDDQTLILNVNNDFVGGRSVFAMKRMPPSGSPTYGQSATIFW